MIKYVDANLFIMRRGEIITLHTVDENHHCYKFNRKKFAMNVAMMFSIPEDAVYCIDW